MKKTSLGFVLVLGLGTMMGCDRVPEGNAGDEALVLRSYAAPGRAREIADVLNGLMRFAEGDTQRRVGNARVAPGDQVLVLAPDSVHQGLAEVIAAQLNKQAQVTPAEITVTYWFVAARPVQGELRLGARLEELRSVLEDLAEAEGAQDFSLYERIDLRQASGNRTSMKSPKVLIYQNASVSGDSVVLSVDAQLGGGDRGNRIDTLLNLQDGQYLVLGQSSLGARRAGESLPDDTTLYTIVRAQSPSLS